MKKPMTPSEALDILFEHATMDVDLMCNDPDYTKRELNEAKRKVENAEKVLLALIDNAKAEG